MNRKFLLYIILITITIALGVGSRKFPTILPEFIQLYAGDTLWTLCAYFLIVTIFRNLEIRRAVIAAAYFSYFIEITQFYHAEWIDSIRGTTIGALALGFGFHWEDLVCYTLGALMGGAIEFYVIRPQQPLAIS